MTHITRSAAAGLSTLVLCSAPLLLPASAAADAGGKAAVEHAERLAAGTAEPNKAQIEQRERQERSTGGTTRPDSPAVQAPAPAPASGAGGAAAWQLALSAALGATLAGGVLVANRQVSSHRHVVAH